MRAITAVVAIFSVYQLCESKLTSMSVKELDCPVNMQTLNYMTLADNITFLPRIASDFLVTLYLPMASPFTFRRYAEVFLGRPAANQSELNAMNWNGIGLSSFGYNRTFTQYVLPYIAPGGLLPSDQILFNFPYLPGTASSGTNMSAFLTFASGLVYGDNASYVILVNCVNGDALEWAVYSSQTTLSSEAQALILEKISAFGFDPTKAEYGSY